MSEAFTANLSHFAQVDPSAVAIVDAQGRSCTRGELAAASNRLSRALRDQGLRPGDVVAIFSHNCVEYLEAYLAATQIGLHVVSINSHLARAEIAHILMDSRAKVLFAHTRLGALAKGALAAAEVQPALRISFGPLDGFTPLEAFRGSYPADPLEAPVVGRMLAYTSATTGRPKGVKLSLDDAEAVMNRIIQTHIRNGIGLAGDNVHLCASMLYHSAPMDWAVIALHMGHKLVLVENWEAEVLLRLIDAHRVTTSFMVPTMFVRIMKLPPEVRSRYSMASLRFVAHGAAPCPVETKKQMLQWWGPVIWEAYGSSEGSGTIVSPEDWLSHPGTVGKPFPGTRLKVLDEDGNEVPPGTPGTIYLTRFTGDRFEYLGDPRKTQAAYRGEFFTAGDVGYLDEQGYLYLCDRKIDMIICGGMNIYPAEIEQVLVQHPQVSDCAVFGIPDELMGEAVKAVVQPKTPGLCGPALTAEIFDFLGKRLSPAKLPRRVEYTAALPRDPNGKIYKRLLRDPHWNQLQRKI